MQLLLSDFRSPLFSGASFTAYSSKPFPSITMACESEATYPRGKGSCCAVGLLDMLIFFSFDWPPLLSNPPGMVSIARDKNSLENKIFSYFIMPWLQTCLGQGRDLVWPADSLVCVVHNCKRAMQVLNMNQGAQGNIDGAQICMV